MELKSVKLLLFTCHSDMDGALLMVSSDYSTGALA